MAKVAKPRIIGFNHVALEVGDIDKALAFLRPTDAADVRFTPESGH
jgi:hypothetical protein